MNYNAVHDSFDHKIIYNLSTIWIFDERYKKEIKVTKIQIIFHTNLKIQKLHYLKKLLFNK